MRVVSLLPSATEILCGIGAQELLVARSHECDHPEEVHPLPVLTAQHAPFTTSAEVDERVRDSLNAGQSLYRLDVGKLQELRPDLIITQDLCAVCSIDLETVRGAAAEMDPSPEILALNPESFEGVLDDVVRVGAAVGLEERATAYMVQLRERFHSAADFVNPYDPQTETLVLEWTDPMFAAGHWTAQMVERAGGRQSLNPANPGAGFGSGAGAQGAHLVAGPAVQVTKELVVGVDPEAIVVSPCGLSLDETRREFADLAKQDWIKQTRAWRAGRIALVDGNQMFSRPGPRLVDAFEWLVGWLTGRSEVIPEGFPWEQWRCD